MKENKNEIVFSKLNILCMISLTFSVIGILKYGIICGAIAIITGIIALITFKKEIQDGKELAILGLAIGITDVIMAIIWVIYFNN